MFSSSTQLKYWTFSGTTELGKLRIEANLKYIKENGASVPEEERASHFLTVSGERLVVRHYEYILKDFCGKFQPPMPRYVVGTSLQFFKRFYLHTSVMDYHPNDIVYTCVYLACKVEEFNVSIMQFVGNVAGDKERAADVILAQELLCMHQLHYHLTVHNPFRPLEGLLIDIKTRCTTIDDADKLRKGADDFLDRSLNTDTCLIFAPSQIALAAILSSAAKLGLNLDSYVANTLLGSGDKQNLMKTVEHIKRIRYMVKNHEPLNREEVRKVEQKLDKCRNEENNPDSNEYKRKMEELFEEKEERKAKKRKTEREAEEEKDKLLLDL